MPPEASRIHWPNWAHRIPFLGHRLFGEHNRRRLEHRWWEDHAGDRPLWLTEVGWQDTIPPRLASAYLWRELLLAEELGVELVCVYAYSHLLTPDGEPTMQADVLRRYSDKSYAT